MFIVGGDNQGALIEPVLDSIIVENPVFIAPRWRPGC